MQINSWRQIPDFKIRDLETARRFMEDCLIEGQCYTIDDLNDDTMYYTLEKIDGEVMIGHTKYGNGLYPPVLMEYDNVDRKIYEARKSINDYFFNDNY